MCSCWMGGRYAATWLATTRGPALRLVIAAVALAAVAATTAAVAAAMIVALMGRLAGPTGVAGVLVARPLVAVVMVASAAVADPPDGATHLLLKCRIADVIRAITGAVISTSAVWPRLGLSFPVTSYFALCSTAPITEFCCSRTSISGTTLGGTMCQLDQGQIAFQRPSPAAHQYLIYLAK